MILLLDTDFEGASSQPLDHVIVVDGCVCSVLDGCRRRFSYFSWDINKFKRLISLSGEIVKKYYDCGFKKCKA